MKLRWLGVCTLALGLVACDDEAPVEDVPAAEAAGEAAEGAEGAEAAVEAKTGEDTGPGVVCNKLIAAIKAKDADVVASLAVGGAAAVPAPAVAGMAAQFAEASCGEEKVDGDSATVTVTAGEDQREIPFAKADDAWKFDPKAYAEKYPPPAAKEPAAKGKKKKGKKKKKKKKKKR